MLSSSSTEHEERIGGRAGRRQQDISSASRVVEIEGRAEARKEGIWFGVEELERRRCVVPISIGESTALVVVGSVHITKTDRWIGLEGVEVEFE